MPHLFIIPDPARFPSGGNLYNQQLIAALRGLGIQADHVEPDQWQPLPTQQQLWVDSLYLDQWDAHSRRTSTNLIVHHLEGMFPERQDFDLQAERQQVKRFERFLCTSSFSVDYLQQMGVEASRCLLVEPACAMDVPVTRTYPQGLQALMVANLMSRKGILPFLNSILNLGHQDDRFTLSIAGNSRLDPDYANECDQLVTSHQMLKRSVRFLGSCSSAEIADLYLSHNLLVSASGMETYGMAIREAQTMGLPVLMLSGGYSERHLSAGQQGLLADHPEELARQFLALAREPDQLQRMTQKQWQQKPGPVSWEDQANLFIQLADS